jgi:hypothetical protein
LTRQQKGRRNTNGYSLKIRKSTPGGHWLCNTYEDLVDVPSDVCQDLSTVTARQNHIEGVLLNGLQEAGRVPEAQNPLLPLGQALHQIVHGNVRGSAAQNLGTQAQVRVSSFLL